MMPEKVECTIPVLPVADLAASVDFYTNTLGFQLDWGDVQNGTVCSVSRDGRPIMLMKHFKPVSPVWIWIGLTDESLFDEYRAIGAKVLQEPRNFTWAYEMKFEDIDGNVLWLGAEPRKNQPYEDE
jgi:predicted lactoylglutathione lyase